MAYIKQTWVDNSSVASAARLNYMEAGIEAAAALEPWTTLTVIKSGATWPARPTSRADIVVQWKGPDPSPAIVSSGTGGMLNGVDVRLVTP